MGPRTVSFLTILFSVRRYKYHNLYVPSAPRGAEVNAMQPQYNDLTKASLLTKISELRADVLSKDWTDDKMMRGGGMQYPYLSTDKILRNVSPLLSKHGVEMTIEYVNPTLTRDFGNMSAHWTVELIVTLWDIESGEHLSNHVFGEAADSLDKGLAKAQTYALKKWITSFFMISDGIDTDNIQPVVSTFKKPTEEEVKVLKTQIKENKDVVAPAEPAKEEKPQEAPAEAPEKKRKAKKAETPAEAEKSAEEPAEAPAEPKAEFKAESTYVMSEPHRKAIEKIIKTWGEATADGRKTKEETEAMMAEFEAISNVPQTFAFIKKYSKV